MPVPLSPVRKTEASVRATWRACSITLRNVGATPRTVTFSLLPYCLATASACS